MKKLKKETRLTVSKKYKNVSIESFITSEEIGASISLSDLQASLFSDMKEPLVRALCEYVGRPTFIMTKKGLNNALTDAIDNVLDNEIAEVFERILTEMKNATVSVAALRHSSED